MNARNLHGRIIAEPSNAGPLRAGVVVPVMPPLNIRMPDGVLDGVRQVHSPNQDERPQGVQPDLIVVHGISLPPGRFGGPWLDRLFTNTLPPQEHPYFAGIAGLRVSTHVLIRRDGEIVQYVPLRARAWHAGPSRFAGRDACNDFSVGIELEGTDDLPYEDVQYDRLGAAIRAMRDAFPSLRHAPVVGHCDVAPGRKTDPGPAFDWRRLDGLLGLPVRPGGQSTP